MEKFEISKKIQAVGSDDSHSMFLVTLQSQAKGVDYHIDLPVKRWVLPIGTNRDDALAIAEEIATIVAKRLRAKMSKQVLRALTNESSATDPKVAELVRMSQIRGLDVLRLNGLSMEIEELFNPQSNEGMLLSLLSIHNMNFNDLYDSFS